MTFRQSDDRIVFHGLTHNGYNMSPLRGCPRSVRATTSPKRQKMPAQAARQITQMPRACLIRYATVKLKGQRRTPNRLESA